MRVIVTGASRGIGRGVVEVLAGAGHVVGGIARSADRLGEVEEAVRASGGRCATTAADLADAAETARAVRTLVERLGGVDALVNNVGVVLRKPFLETTDEDWSTLLGTNVLGVVHPTRCVLPRLVEQGSGHLVFVSSISGYLPLPGGAGYAATKFAVTGLAESLMHEVRDAGVKVTTVFPGSVDTESHRDGSDASWKVSPGEVGEAVLAALETRAGTLVSRIEIRPLGRPPRP
jgi:3-oxoacyl-[acyl-carrier protein] reductase